MTEDAKKPGCLRWEWMEDRPGFVASKQSPPRGSALSSDDGRISYAYVVPIGGLFGSQPLAWIWRMVGDERSHVEPWEDSAKYAAMAAVKAAITKAEGGAA